MTHKITSDFLPDMQKTETGFYKKRIAKVGVRGIKQYLPIHMKDGSTQTVFANISSYCSLDETFKGINMSRITRTINETLRDNANGFLGLEEFVKRLSKAHNSPDVYIKAAFKMILPQTSPMSELYSQEPIDVTIESIVHNNMMKTFLEVETVAMSLCPCSKEMSLLKNNITSDEAQALEALKATNESLYKKIVMAGYGAHNQRSHIRIKVELNHSDVKSSTDIMWIEDLYQIANSASSCHTRSVLKRPDEKYQTEVSYLGGYFDDDKEFVEVPTNGPKFTEDIARDVAEQLDPELDKSIKDYVIVVNNEESIHTGEIMATSVLNAGRELD